MMKKQNKNVNYTTILQTINCIVNIIKVILEILK